MENFKTFLTLLAFLSIVQDVYLLNIRQNVKQFRTTKNPDYVIYPSYDEIGDVLVRIKKELVKLGSCPRGKERYEGKCRTQEEIERLRNNDYDDYDDGVTEPAFEFVPLIPKETVKEPEYDLSSSMPYDPETGTVTLAEGTDLQEESTQSTLNTNAKKIGAVSPKLILQDEIDSGSEKIKYLTYELLVICSGAIVLTCLVKLLFDIHRRRDDDKASHSCSKDDLLCGSNTSRCRLCS